MLADKDIRENIQENMNHIGIKESEKVFSSYDVRDPYIMKFLKDRYRSAENEDTYFGGGKKIEKIEYEFENYKFMIFKLKIHDGYDILIKRNNDIESPESCLHIMINSKIGLAYIKNISYYPECVKTEYEYQSKLKYQTKLKKPGGGGILLRLCLKYLRENKTEYRLKRVQLMDNSFMKCEKNGKNISLSVMHTLAHGTTWYGKYGFRPYDPDTDTENMEDSVLFDKNREIVTKTIVRNTNLFNYLYEIIKTKENEMKAKQITNKYYELYKDYTVSQFFKEFLSKYDRSCSMFSAFYKNYAASLGIWNFHGSSFYLDL